MVDNIYTRSDTEILSEKGMAHFNHFIRKLGHFLVCSVFLPALRDDQKGEVPVTFMYIHR